MKVCVYVCTWWMLIDIVSADFSWLTYQKSENIVLEERCHQAKLQTNFVEFKLSALLLNLS